MAVALPTWQSVWPMMAISLPPLTTQARASERIVLLSGPVMMLPAFRSQMNWSLGIPITSGSSGFRSSGVWVTGSSSRSRTRRAQAHFVLRREALYSLRVARQGDLASTLVRVAE